MTMKTIKVLPNLDVVNSELRQIIQETYDNCKKRLFTIGLSGGSVITCLTTVLPTLQVNWKKVRFFFCDERIVPFDDPESTFGCYWKALEGVIPIEKDQFIEIDTTLDGDEVAKKYIQRIGATANVDRAGFPVFNLLLLGMGPDGHTASLFPNHKALEETKEWVTYIDDSPKPPPKRITLTLPVINNAETVIFVSTGASKAEILKKIIVEGEDYPAGRVNPKKGELFWLLDKAAGSLLPAEMGGSVV